MSRRWDAVPILVVALYQLLGGFFYFQPKVMRPLSLVALVLLPFIAYRHHRGQASGVEGTLGVYLLLAALGFWLMPASLGLLMARYPLTMLYGLLFLLAALPPWLGAEPFTCFYARRHAPPAGWPSDLFLLINQHLTGMWAVLFALSAAATLIPAVWPVLDTLLLRIIFNAAVPLALMFGVGLPMNRWYPAYAARRHPGPAASGGDPRR